MGPPGSALRVSLLSHERIGVDSSTLIYFLEGEAGRAALTQELLMLAAKKSTSLVVSVVTQIEMMVAPLARGQEPMLSAIDELLASPSLEVVEVTRSIGRVAAQIRAQHRMNLGDAIIGATALESGCSAIVGNDRDFARLSDRIAYLHLDDMRADL